MHARGHHRAGHHAQHQWSPLSLLRHNVFYLALLLAALVLWLGNKYLRHSLYGSRDNESVMALATCAARLTALGVAADDSNDLDSLRATNYVQQRHKVYSHMAEDLERKGLQLGGVITQGLTQRDLFTITVLSDDLRRIPRKLSLSALTGRDTGRVHIAPVLKPLEVPVRAMILPLLDRAAAKHIGKLVHQLLVPSVPDGGIWVQDPNLFHATVFHASSHVKPVPAAKSQIDDEHQRIMSVTTRTCPIQAVLERVVLTSGGVIVACWQAKQQGGEPALLRAGLAQALPDAPPKEAQMVKEPAMLHTTLARLLQAPALGAGGGAGGSMTTTDPQTVSQAVQQLSDSLCGLQTVFNEVWFVEEQDLLALALQGRYIRHPAPLVCPREGVEQGEGGT